ARATTERLVRSMGGKRAEGGEEWQLTPLGAGLSPPIDEVTGAGLFTLLFAEAVRAPRVGMIAPRVMLAQQVLAVVVAVRGAHDRVDMIAGGFVVRIDDSWLMVEFDEHHWTVDAVVEGAVVVVRANPGKVRVA